MPNVFATNTTSASITVAGHKVYYIDSTDAEIVEVEGTSGQALPSVGDTVTFGNYPQATSTPEPIEWTVLAVDSVNGKALLLSKYILDAHIYNAEKVSVSWATCTLRDWLNDTFYNAAFNSEEQSGIVTTHNAGSGLSSDDKVFCLTQDESASYIPVEADRRAVATQKAIDDGVYSPSEEKYGNWWNLDWDVDSYYRVDMISSSGGLSSAQITITWMGVRPAIWVSFSGVTTFKYNAFKYLLSGTPYYYVIDGEHDTWTDDLSEWGYSEVQPVVTLPEVSIDSNPVGSGTQTLVVNDFTGPLHYMGSGGWSGDAIPYDTNKKYSLTTYNNGTLGGLQACGIFVPISVSTQSGGPYYVGVKNISSTSQSFMSVYVATCSSNLATVVTVYDSSNVAYNAFKYTANDTDYYYVLDGTQDDWTDDLSSIGYSDTPVVVLPTVVIYASPSTFCAFDNDGQSVSIGSGNSRNMVYSWTGNQYSSIVYNNSKICSLIEYRNGNAIVGRVGLQCFRYSSPYSPSKYIGVTNISEQTITVDSFDYAECSDLTATVVTVYDTNNVAYNAFKFTANNTEYYYVLDGTQTDWTDDLSSIGYHNYEEIVLYMPGGSGVTYGSQYGVTSGYKDDPNSQYLYPLYSDPECTIPASYDATKRYEAGYYHYQTGEWTVKPIQTVTDMPSSTVSQFSDKTTAEILHNDNGVVKLWAINNYVSSYPSYVFSYGSNPVSFRFRLQIVI